MEHFKTKEKFYIIEDYYDDDLSNYQEQEKNYLQI